MYKQKRSLQKIFTIVKLRSAITVPRNSSQLTFIFFQTVSTYLRHKIMQLIHGFHSCYPHHSDLQPDPALMLSEHICENQVESTHVSHPLLFLTYHVIEIWCHSCPNLW